MKAILIIILVLVALFAFGAAKINNEYHNNRRK